ncbi:MAG: nucleotide-binding protein [Candidatus Ranarchaeia archaeon]
MKQLTVISGKGGTGKTTFTGALAALSDNAIITDCDVDAPNLHLIMNPTPKKIIPFKGAKLASINPEKCTQCNRCVDACRFSAINPPDVSRVDCEGCGTCVLVCDEGAISLDERISGHIYVSKTRFGTMVHAKLEPGEANSGKLVSEVRKTAMENARKTGYELAINDGPPGIGCHVIASITGTDHVLIIVEPSMSSLHDMKRIIDLVRHFRIPASVCVNKYDINKKITEKIISTCTKNNVTPIGKIPFDPVITEAMVAGKSIVEHKPAGSITKKMKQIWKKLRLSL